MINRLLKPTLAFVLYFTPFYLAPVAANAAAAQICREIFAKPLANTTQVDPHAASLFESIFHDKKVSAQLAQDFETLKANVLAGRSKELLADDAKSLQDPNGLLDRVQYMGYVDGIGTKNGKGTFRTLKNMINYLTDHLGVSMVYALPFLKSPFGDAGFDVADYRSVDDRYGGDHEFAQFKEKLLNKDGRFQMDLVFNHTSNEHEWAKKALAGDPYYRAFFHILEQAPHVLSVEKNKDGKPVSAKYLEKGDDGKDQVVERRVIFPDFADINHPHYVKTTDAQGKTIWVYHTFYPFQFDLNYKNPAVMRETLSIAGHWANLGVDVIRLDAIPFLFKNQESDPRTMKFVETLRYFLAKVSPRTSLIVEACQEPAIVYKFFGKTEKIHVDHLNQDLNTSSGAQLAYNFDLMSYSWASLLSGDKSFFIENLKNTPEPPTGTVWANFLRLHDELTLEMAPESVRKVIRHELLDKKKGAPFRGDLGVGGRMADFLDRDPARMKLAFSLLLSLKGMPILYYGDEIMAGNNKAYAQSAAAARGGQYDARDEGRGPVEVSSYNDAVKAGSTTPEGHVLNDVRRLIQVRKQRNSIRRGDTVIVETSEKSVVALERITENEKTLVVHNLSDQTVIVALKLSALPKELFELLGERKLEFTIKGDQIVLKLARFETLWLAE